MATKAADVTPAPEVEASAQGTPETPILITETTVKVSVNSMPLKATVEDIGAGTTLTTVVEQDPRFDTVAGTDQ